MLMTRRDKIDRLEYVTLILYENEDPDNYDIDGAVCYWRAMSNDELDLELTELEQRLTIYLLPK